MLDALVDQGWIRTDASRTSAKQPFLGVVGIAMGVEHLHVVELLLLVLMRVYGTIHLRPLQAHIQLLIWIKLAQTRLKRIRLPHVHATVLTLGVRAARLAHVAGVRILRLILIHLLILLIRLLSWIARIGYWWQTLLCSLLRHHLVVLVLPVHSRRRINVPLTSHILID